MADYKVSEVVDKLCFNCRKIGEEPTKTCVACGIARYCGKECQMEHRPEHKERCLTIKKGRKRVAKLEKELRQQWGPSNPYGETWDGYVGNFWGSVDARDYCRGMFCLSYAFIKIAEGFDAYVENPEGLLAMREAEKILLELLRLSHGDNQGIRFWYPAVLLALDRFQDCFDFVHWWASIDPDGKYDWGEAPAIEKGEWPYPRNNDMLLDLQEYPRVGGGYLDAFHLIVLIILKMWIIEKLKSGEKTPLDFNSPLIWGLEGYIEDQEDMLRMYCAVVEMQNEHLLPGIINPAPMLENLPSAYSCGSYEEAQEVVHVMHRVCKKFGAQEKIQEIIESDEYLEEYLGSDPFMIVEPDE